MLKKVFLGTLGLVILFTSAIFAAIHLSSWPSAAFVRGMMERDGVAAAEKLEKHVPSGVTARLNLHYDAGDDAILDVFYPSSAGVKGAALPTIVWVHGGGFVAGSKDEVASYLKIIAARGFTVVGVNYSLAPRASYPNPIREVNAALAFLKGNARRFHIDLSKLFLAGDSAGAQIAAQVANIISDPSYARQMGMKPAIQRPQLKGIILFCGIYDPDQIRLQGAFGGFLRTVGWSYFGRKDFLNDPRMAQFSVVRHVTADFPPMFISAGNADPLASHSYALADIAESEGVPVDRLFFPSDHMPALSHEYQFNLDTAAGRIALERAVQFLSAIEPPPPA